MMIGTEIQEVFITESLFLQGSQSVSDMSGFVCPERVIISYLNGRLEQLIKIERAEIVNTGSLEKKKIKSIEKYGIYGCSQVPQWKTNQ